MEPQGREVLLGVTGCIGAYKTADLVRQLRRAGVGVTVVLTRHAAWFVTEGTLQTLSERRVYTDLFTPVTPEGIEHIDLARRSDLLLVAPATASIIGKFAAGIADDFLSTLHLAYRGPVLMAPAMNTSMYRHAAVQHNLEVLAGRGVGFIGPGSGDLACGEHGEGRLMEAEAIVQAVLQRLQTPARPAMSLSGRRVLVTAGPTREPLDPVRFISNPSTGQMGFAVAGAAAQRGAQVVLITGPTPLTAPAGVEVVRVETARQMHAAVAEHAPGTDLIVMAAAVGDYEAAPVAAAKIKKTTASLTLKLSRTPDILGELGASRPLGSPPILVGFAAETAAVEAEAGRKLEQKNLDYVVANQIGEPDAGFAAQTNRVIFMRRQGESENWPLLSKEEVAARLLDRVAAERLGAGIAAGRRTGN